MGLSFFFLGGGGFWVIDFCFLSGFRFWSFLGFGYQNWGFCFPFLGLIYLSGLGIFGFWILDLRINIFPGF